MANDEAQDSRLNSKINDVRSEITASKESLEATQIKA
jgi:hypothetical protein